MSPDFLLRGRAPRDAVAIRRVTPPRFLTEANSEVHNDNIVQFSVRSKATLGKLYSRTSGVLLIG